MILALLNTSLAATLVVDPDTTDGYTTIADALAVAVTGDVLELSGDTFAECINAGIDLTIRGTTGTVLDGTGVCDNVLIVDDGESVTVEDLEIVNGDGRGLYQYYSTTTLDGVTFRDSATGSGAGIYTYGGALSTTACTFTNNAADYGGAIYLYAYGSWTDTDSVFTGNTATDAGGAVESYYDNTVALTGTRFSTNTAGGSGGGLWHGWWGDLSLTDTVFEDNAASTGYGGGLYLYAQDEAVPIAGATFSRNTSASHGGAIGMHYYADLTVSESVFQDNAAGGNGGGIYSYHTAHVTVSNSTFSGNSGTSGGAILHYPTDGGYDLTVTDSTFTDNTATDGHGGALYTAWSNRTELAGSTFQGNDASNYGGVLYVYVANAVDTSHSLSCDNSARVGGSHAIEWATTDAMWNTRVVNNTADYAGGLWRYASYSGFVSYNTFAGNDGLEDGGAYYANAGYAAWTGNIVAHTGDGNGVVASDTNSLLHTTWVDNGWADNHVLDGGGYFWIEAGVDGHVVTDAPGFVSYGEGCEVDLRLPHDAPLAGMGAYAGPDAAVEDHDGDGDDTTVDCDDTNADMNTGADEVCNGVDDDCDGEVDVDALDQGTWYIDEDGDGYGTEAIQGCEPPDGAADHPDDCDDADAAVNPGATEVLDDGVDNDCDGTSQETPAVEPEVDDHLVEPEGRWGCTATPLSPGWGLLALAGLLVRRRR